ncbi:hypothetical protein F5Y17DRAFT_232049 [Xylariaceae sp. FL0594]|nr:hypothetical protein F5Y17DRAFT_232049 [Xylariaceae sp. FL0594]
MAVTLLLWSLVVLSVYLIAYYILNPDRRNAALQKVARGGVPPPQLIKPSADKQPLSAASRPLASSASDIATTFPPSLRGELSELSKSLSPEQREVLGDLSFSQERFERSLLRLDEDYATADEDKYVYSGFSVREIKALGDFPDYSALSGVPLPKPYPEFDIDRAKPRPYRPWRWPYHQTMCMCEKANFSFPFAFFFHPRFHPMYIDIEHTALTKLDPDWWLELESSYRERIAQRKALYQKHGPLISQHAPGSELACKELMETALQFLCARYPQYFSLTSTSEDESNGGEKNIWFENRILGVRDDIRTKHPLMVLLDHVPEDFNLMLRDPDTGAYVLRAGIICSALGWSLGAKFGMKLHEIHGPVPDYKEKMQFSMDRFFSKMPTSKPIQRASWDFSIGQLLFLKAGDDENDKEAHGKRRTQDPGLARSDVHLRVDWQTLRRLPLSGAVVFNFKAVFTPLEDLCDEPYVPSLVLKVLREGNERILEYKNTWHTEHVVIPALEEYEHEQIQKGIIEKDWEPRTLEESPYFPGWEKKWHAQQGF